MWRIAAVFAATGAMAASSAAAFELSSSPETLMTGTPAGSRRVATAIAAA